MGIHGIDNDNVVGGEGSAPSEVFENTKLSSSTTTRGSGKFLGLIPGGMKLMGSNQSSGYTAQFTKEMKKILDEDEKTANVNLFVLDKEEVKGLTYSYIVLATKGTKVKYYTILLEATGRKPLTALEIMDEYAAAQKLKQVSNRIWTTDDAFNQTLNATIAKMLVESYKITLNSGDKIEDHIVNLDGVIIPYSIEDVNEAAYHAVRLGYNALTVDDYLENNGDINIRADLENAKNSSFRVDTSINKITALDEFKSPVRADWRAELVLSQDDSKFNAARYIDGLNKENTSWTMAKVCGFVDAIADAYVTRGANGVDVETTRMRPHIIITSNDVEQPTPNAMLIGIISGMVMTGQDMWMGSVLPDGGKYNVGALNLKTNLRNNENGIGAKLDLVIGGKEKLTEDDIFKIVEKMFCLSPVVSMDIPAYGPQTYYTSALTAAAVGSTGSMNRAALQFIVDAASSLTDGCFPSNFPIDAIFNSEGILIPLGTWRDKNGQVRDIREVDLTMIASETEDIELMNRWILSSLPYSVTRIDPYLTKVDIISRIIPKAEITSKAVRVTFTSDFVQELVSAAAKAGLVMSYEPEIKLLENRDASLIRGYLDRAGIGAINGFNRRGISTGPSYSTLFSHNGRRYM